MYAQLEIDEIVLSARPPPLPHRLVETAASSLSVDFYWRNLLLSLME
jgi:hypothetical protein